MPRWPHLAAMSRVSPAASPAWVRSLPLPVAPSVPFRIARIPEPAETSPVPGQPGARQTETAASVAEPEGCHRTASSPQRGSSTLRLAVPHPPLRSDNLPSDACPSPPRPPSLSQNPPKAAARADSHPPHVPPKVSGTPPRCGRLRGGVRSTRWSDHARVSATTVCGRSRVRDIPPPGNRPPVTPRSTAVARHQNAGKSDPWPR